MSETLCTLRTKGGGGGKYTETSLWTNSAPTSDFAGQTVTLSDNISNYKYIAIKFKAIKTSSETDAVVTVIPVESLERMNVTSATPDIRISGTVSGGTTGYSRYVIKASDTTISFGSAYATNTQASSNTMAIPLEILGLNELAQGEKPVIPTFSIQIAAANNRSAAAMNLDVASYNTLTIGSVTKGSGVTVRNAQIRDVNNTVLYTINVSSSEQTFDVSAQTRVVIVLDASGTTAWQELKADNFYLS